MYELLSHNYCTVLAKKQNNSRDSATLKDIMENEGGEGGGGALLCTLFSYIRVSMNVH